MKPCEIGVAGKDERQPGIVSNHETAEASGREATGGRPLRVLLVEDSENDAALLEIELERAGYTPVCQRVETAAALSAALARQKFDLIIADYVLPRFNGLEALSLVKGRGVDSPFIIVSGHITDNTAVAAMKAGAHDYVMKDNLARLGPAVQRELREAEVRRERRRADQKLQVEQVFRQAIENSVPAGISAVDLEGRQTYVNPAFCDMVGWQENELVGALPPFVYWPPGEFDRITGAFGQVIEGRAAAGGLELRFRRRTGERLDVLLQITPLKDQFGNITGWVSAASDITERKRAENRLAAEHAITRLLAGVDSIEAASPGILEVLLESLGTELGMVWLVDPQGPALRPAVLRLRAPSPQLEAFAAACRQARYGQGAGLPGQVWQQCRPAWITELQLEPDFQRAQAARGAGCRSALAFPILNGGDCFGVVEFFATRRMESEPALVNMLTAIGSEIGQFIQKRHAEEALRRAHDELEQRVEQRTRELATANTSLQAAIAERQRLETELLEITEKERRRIGLDLHDDLGQRLSGIALMTKGLELKLARVKSEEGHEAAKIHSLVQEAMNRASDLAHDLTTLEVGQKDLPTALQDLARRARELFGITCRFVAEGSLPALETKLVIQLSKIAQEAVTNAIKHGQAKRVTVTLATSPGQLTLTIQNSGVPFPDLHGYATGMGLRIMNYRANLIGGTLAIRGLGSRGTLVTCRVPLETTSGKGLFPGGGPQTAASTSG